MTFIDSTCPKCRKEIRVDSALKSYYCNACGEKISLSSADAKNSASAKGLVDWTCPKCHREIRIDKTRESCYCNACGALIQISGKTTSPKSAPSANTRSEANQPLGPSSAPTTNTSSSRPSTGKAIGFGFLCYAIIASIMAFTSIFVFQAMGYSIWIGPNLISLAIGIFFGVVYKTTGKASSLVMFSVLIGLALGFALPYFVASMH